MGKMKRELKKKIKNKKYNPDEHSMFNQSIKPLSYFIRLVFKRTMEYTFKGEMLSHIWNVLFTFIVWIAFPISIPLLGILLKSEHIDDCIRTLSKIQNISYKEAKEIYKHLVRERRKHYEK